MGLSACRLAGALLIGTLVAPTAAAASPPQLVEDCANGFDDDGDGLIDQEDPDCSHADGFLVVFHDRDGDGERFLGAPGRPPEPGLAGWEIHFIVEDGSHTHDYTGPDGSLFFAVSPGLKLICETLSQPWSQTAPSSGADCSGHTHGGTITPGSVGFDVGSGEPVALEFGNSKSCVAERHSRAFGARGALLPGPGLGIGPTPDSDVANPDTLLSVPNFMDPWAPPMLSMLHVSETNDGNSVAATATTDEVDVQIPGLDAYRVQADSVRANSRSYLTPDGVASTSDGSFIANLRIGGVAYGDVADSVSLLVKDLVTDDPVLEVHVLAGERRGAAAGVPQPHGGRYRSGLDVSGLRIVVHDLPATDWLDESAELVIAHATTDIAAAAC